MDRRWCERQQVSWTVTVQDSRGRLLQSEARNITLEGMLIALEEPEDFELSIGDKVIVQVDVPQEEGNHLRHSADATVVHLRDRGAGLHFHCFSDHKCRELERELYNCMYPHESADPKLNAA